MAKNRTEKQCKEMQPENHKDLPTDGWETGTSNCSPSSVSLLCHVLS